MKLYFIILQVIFFQILLASNIWASPFFAKEKFQVALGLQADSLIYKRGIITYEGPQAFPIYAVSLFHPDLILAGSALYYKQRVLYENLYFRTRLNVNSTNDTPLYFTTEKEEDRIRREDTTELDLFLEYLMPNESFLRLNLSQDLVAHKGHYLELRARLGLLNLIKNEGERALIQAGLFVAAGYGDQRHNEYFYGQGANKSGVNNIEYGISVVSPKVIDLFWPTFTISRFHLLGEENKNGSFVQELKGWSAQALFAFKVW